MPRFLPFSEDAIIGFNFCPVCGKNYIAENLNREFHHLLNKKQREGIFSLQLRELGVYACSECHKNKLDNQRDDSG